MNMVIEIPVWQKLRQTLHGKKIGFVPTMGNLHEGHLSLCRHAKANNDLVVVSIFVNPTQFNNFEDLQKYPRTLEQDQQLLASEGIDYLFVPQAANMYPDHYTVQVTEIAVSNILEGHFRPAHFAGMLTVVLKLLNLVQPTCAYFGEKDYQQILLVKKMVEALFLDTEIVACETVRDERGLALSSRNSRLNESQLAKAAFLYKILKESKQASECVLKLKQEDFEVEYVEDRWSRRLAAVWLDGVRLIDNIKIAE